MSDEPVVYAEDVMPTLVGTHGKAWKMDVEAAARRYPDGPPAELTVSSWIVEARYAHPLWHSYAIFAVNLREIPGFPAAHIYRAGSTHEAIVMALNPDCLRPLNARPSFLTPVNFAGQWVAGSDKDAADYMEETVNLVINGQLSPDTDYIQHWIRRFSDSNIKGNPRRAGETRIVIEGKGEVVIPPQP